MPTAAGSLHLNNKREANTSDGLEGGWIETSFLILIKPHGINDGCKFDAWKLARRGDSLRENMTQCSRVQQCTALKAPPPPLPRGVVRRHAGSTSSLIETRDRASQGAQRVTMTEAICCL